MRAILTTLAFALGATSALADTCKTQGAADAKELTFDLKDEKVLIGLRAAFQLGLTPKEFPEEDIAKIKAPCSRGLFPIGSGKVLELHGENEDTPPRWAQPAAGGPTIFIAVVPKPEPARRWEQSTNPSGEVSVTFGDDDMMYALVFATGADKRLVFHFFDKIPDDPRLKALLEPIVGGKGRWLVGVDLTTRQVVPNTN